MDSNYPARLRPGASRDPRRAGRANQGAGRDDRQQHHYRIQQYQHQSQHHHQDRNIDPISLLELIDVGILVAALASALPDGDGDIPMR
ncbi:hypothetical protein PENSOL_c035G01711 [Penicillium solitum]|uniref:Uncharacterized protein n=1 Tax=Penicillium solitum TaxID=60172 RepID=A0A1V6QVU7_9EURO|nr:uncharacterized protein PENSOL_c035G01711 [Penicillium solitum]OQD93066.1 hypothetical protein PENSOL_c035G01711 [Penicillium solitum]